MRAEFFGGMFKVEGTPEEVAILTKLIAPVALIRAYEKVGEDAEKAAWRQGEEE